MQAKVKLFCLQAKRRFSLQTLEGKEITVALYYHYVLLGFWSVCSKHGVKTALFLLLELLSKVGQGRQHVNSLRGWKNNNLMDCFCTSSQLHCNIHPHTHTQSLLCCCPFSSGSLLSSIYSLSTWLLKQRQKKRFCHTLAIYMMSSCLTAPIKNIRTT